MLQITQTKKCNKCGETKSFDEFSNNKIKKDGKHPRCKACDRVYHQTDKRKAYQKAYNQTEERKAYQKAYNQTEIGKAYQKAYSQTTKYKEYQKAYKHTDKSKAYQKAYRQTEECQTYQKAYRQTDKRKAYQKAYKQTDEYKEYQKAYCQTEEHKAYQKAYNQRDEVKAYKKAYQQTAEEIAKRKAYYQTEIGKAIDKNAKHKRRAITREGDVTTSQLLKLQQTAAHCYWCKKKLNKMDTHVDHYEPLSKGGKHTLSNLVVACSACNLSKHAKDPYEFAMSLGRLL